MMKHMVQRSLSFIALTGMLACTGDPTGDFANGVDHLEATPGALFVTEGTPELVIVTARDGSNNPVTANFTVSGVGAGITVERDLTYEPVRNSDGELEPNNHPIRVRYIVSNTAATATTSFTVNAGGESTTINVRVVPVAGSVPNAVVGTASPAAGSTTSLTLPAPYRFTAASVISFSGSTLIGQNKTLSADSSTVTFFAPVGLTASTATVNNVVLSYAPTQATFTVTSATAFTTATPVITLNRTTAVAGDTIVATAPASFRFTPASTVSVPGAGNAIVSLSADSSTIRFLIGPSASGGVVTVTSLIYQGTNFAPATFSSTQTLTTPAVTNVPLVFASATPNINENFTVTTSGGFKFLANSRIRFGSEVLATVSVAADSNSMVVRARTAGASGQVRAENVVLGFLPTVAFGAPSTGTATVGATVIELTGTAVPGTGAPTIGLPLAVTQTAGLTDAPTAFGYAGLTGACGGPCPTRIYKVVAPAATKISITANWNSNADLGVYALTAAGALASTTTFPPADNLGGGAGGHPETTTWTVPAGTSYIGVISFDTAGLPTSLTLAFVGVP